MKVNRRSVPNDILSIEQDGCKIWIGTHRHNVVISIEQDGKEIHNESLTFFQFQALLMTHAGGPG